MKIRLEGCAKSFGGTRILDPVDLEIADGETLVLLGPSGCGKTTTLRLIAGLEAPDPGGRILFGETDVTRWPIERRRVGMVFQSYALFPNMSVAGNIEYGLKVRRDPPERRRARVAEMLAMMRLEAHAGRRIEQLSGGQRQRVALARALAVEPAVLLLDEPLTALDAKLRDALRTEIAELLRRVGLTAIFVTHDQGEAMALGDRIVVMEQGRIAQIGTPRQVYAAPATRFVAEFVGTMNCLPGAARGDGWHTPVGILPWPAAPSAGDALFRPEAVRIATNGPLAATVAARFFLGDRQRLVLEVPGNRPITVETDPTPDLAVGQTVRFAIDPGQLRHFPGAT